MLLVYCILIYRFIVGFFICLLFMIIVCYLLFLIFCLLFNDLVFLFYIVAHHLSFPLQRRVNSPQRIDMLTSIVSTSCNNDYFKSCSTFDKDNNE